MTITKTSYCRVGGLALTVIAGYRETAHLLFSLATASFCRSDRFNDILPFYRRVVFARIPPIYTSQVVPFFLRLLSPVEKVSFLGHVSISE